MYFATYRFTRVLSSPDVSRERTALTLHLVGGLPRPDDHLTDPAHRLRVRGHHADRAEIVQHVLGGDRLGADARFGEREVLGDPRVEVVADHQHVEMLVHGVHGERHRRVGRRGQAVRLAAHADDVGRVTAAGALGVVRVNGPPLERADRVLDEPALVERVGVDRDLHVELVGDAERAVDRRRRRPPVFVELEPDGARHDLLAQRIGRRRVALAEEAQVDRERLGRLEHAVDVPRAGRARRGVRSGRGAGAAAEQRREPGADRLTDQLGTDEVDVRVEPARRDDLPSPAMTSVDAPTTIPSVTPAIRSGFPALPTAAIRPSRIPMSAFTMPQ